MARAQLFYSSGKLLAATAATAILGSMAFAVGFGMSDADLARSGPVGLLGPTLLRTALIIGGAYFAIVCLAALLCLIGDRTAAAIRADGVEVRGLFASHYVAWASIQRVHLYRSEIARQAHHFIQLDTDRPSFVSVLAPMIWRGICWAPARFVAASDTEIAEWIEEANSARQEALAARAQIQPRPRMEPTRAAFGRRTR